MQGVYKQQDVEVSCRYCGIDDLEVLYSCPRVSAITQYQYHAATDFKIVANTSIERQHSFSELRVSASRSVQRSSELQEITEARNR